MEQTSRMNRDLYYEIDKLKREVAELRARMNSAENGVISKIAARLRAFIGNGLSEESESLLRENHEKYSEYKTLGQGWL